MKDFLVEVERGRGKRLEKMGVANEQQSLPCFVPGAGVWRVWHESRLGTRLQYETTYLGTELVSEYPM